MIRNSRRSGAGRARGAWLGAAAALLLIPAQSASSSPLWGVNLCADSACYNSATGGSGFTGSGSEGVGEPAGVRWSAPTVAGLKAASAEFDWWCQGGPLLCNVVGGGYAQAAGSLGNASVSVSVQGDEAWADLSDTLTFSAAGATSSTVSDIGVHFMVSGTDWGSWDSLPNDLWLDERLQLGTGTIEYAWDGYSYGLPLTKTDSGWVSSRLRADDTGSLIFDGIYEFYGSSATVPFSMGLLTITGNVSTGELGAPDGRAASVTLSLPRGVTYTSASGAFPGSVPEPAAWVMMMGGLGLIGTRQIRKR